MNPEIFRQYDIRGIAGKDLNEENVFKIGQAIGSYLLAENKKEFCVGKDCRLTSDSYAKALIKGLCSTGCNVIDIGTCPTPVLYFSIQEFKKDGGVMVTASHNPKEYNGFKLCRGLSSIFGDEIQNIFKIIEKGEFKKGQGFCKKKDAITPYMDFIKKNIKIKKKLRIGIDAGNGTAGPIALPLIKNFGCEVFDIYCDMDGNFPNHIADPTVEKYMKDLSDLVKKEKLDFGIGYDGDSDRVGIIDENGKLLLGDQLMIIFSREILSRKPNSVFISEVKASKTMYDDIEKKGGKAIMWKAGHSFIKEKMKEENAELAGEVSGHIFFKDRFFGFDDAIYASLRFIELLSNTSKTTSELLSDVPKVYSSPEMRFDCPDNIKFKLVKKLSKKFKKKHKTIDIDGVRIVFDDGWGLLRASNTQGAIVMRFEALSEKRLEEIKKYMLEEIKKEADF